MPSTHHYMTEHSNLTHSHPLFNFTKDDMTSHLTEGLETIITQALNNPEQLHEIKHLQIVHDGILNPIFVRVHYSYSWLNSSRGTIDLMLKQALSKRFNVEVHYIELTRRGYYEIRLTLQPKE